ncbi:hypothetical protein AAMO2058_001031500 [Amorphochlora amoebiformis]|uniref:Uncharacterized protein n=1 Tax=Amorphochlora amoebiformis TaxID=1561963 RepID=A0A7S0CZW3_9EUKA|mmetsp:Transcript_15486/g.24524  ORF Transcript_15486/g.24524 Transcript_15486/m.24524 type:complete len:178 (+) Transcript_15486:28-561(+)
MQIMQWSWCVIGVVLASNVFTAAIMMWIFTRKDSQTLPNVNKPPGSVCAVAESTEGLCNAVVDRRPFSDLATWEREIIKQVAASGPGDWNEKLALLPADVRREAKTSKYLDDWWCTVGPQIQEVIRKQSGLKCCKESTKKVEMPCGSTCASCKTRDTCRLHQNGASPRPLRDLEDLF